jgi:hypothetical protein
MARRTWRFQMGDPYPAAHLEPRAVPAALRAQSVKFYEFSTIR